MEGAAMRNVRMLLPLPAKWRTLWAGWKWRRGTRLAAAVAALLLCIALHAAGAASAVSAAVAWAGPQQRWSTSSDGRAQRWCRFRDVWHGRHGQWYLCTPLFDPAYYRAAYPDAAGLGADAEAEEHYATVGVPAGRRMHGGHKVMKLVLMTYNEWPLLQAWVLYHAALFGGDNLYVLDSSTDPAVAAFLARAQRELGVNVLWTAADLNGLAGIINELMAQLARSADFLIKLDTDELLTLAHVDATSGRRRYTVEGLREYLDAMPVDGRKYKCGYSSNAFPDPQCTAGSQVALVHAFEHPWPTRIKTFFHAWTFGVIDLGSHDGNVRPPYNDTGFVTTRLALAHFHFNCHAVVVANNHKAMLKHGYLREGDSAAAQLAKLDAISGGGASCRVLSCHKLLDYRAYLLDPEGHRARYNGRTFDPKHPESMAFTGIADLLRPLIADFDAGRPLRLPASLAG